MLTRFAVKNYKCLADVDIPLTPIHVLIGENDTGKTSLLEAMYAFHRSSTSQQVAQAFPGIWDGTDLVNERASEPRIALSGEMGIDGENIGYGFTAQFGETRKRCLSGEEWIEVAAGRETLADESARHHRTVLSERLSERGRWTNDTETLSRVLGRADLYRFDARMLATPTTIRVERKFRLDEDGFGLATLIDELLSYEFELVAAIQSTFCRYFPQFRAVRLQTVKAMDRTYADDGTFNVSRGDGKGVFFETTRGRLIRAQQASDGALLFLGLLTLLHLPEPPKMLLFEEPETGIYPKRLEEVITLLRDFINNSSGRPVPQIVITTHSPYVLTFFQPEEVTFMGRQPDGSVRARPLRDAPHIRERMEGGFYLGELWYNLTEAELFGDA